MSSAKEENVKIEILNAGATSAPSTVNKTGAWRTFKPVINDNCRACRICVKFCPDSCIEIGKERSKDKALIDYDFCKGCLICEKVCPFKAITHEREEK